MPSTGARSVASAICWRSSDACAFAACSAARVWS
jgi:hypothetical protein